MVLRHRQLRFVHLQPRAVPRRAGRGDPRAPQRRGDARRDRRDGARRRSSSRRGPAGPRTPASRWTSSGGSARRRRFSACASGIRRSASCTAARCAARRRRCTARRRRSCTTAGACSRASASRFRRGRYHSLVIADDDVPAELEVAARTREDGIIMAVRHRTYPVHGVQFHPESVLTDEGRQILRNFLDLLTMFTAPAREAACATRTCTAADEAAGRDARSDGRARAAPARAGGAAGGAAS